MAETPIQIVVVDGATLNPGDLSWEPLEELGKTTVYEGTSPCDLVSRVAEAQAIVTNKVRIEKKHFENLPHLRYIGVTATGYDCVDIAAARSSSVVVTNVPAYSTRSVAQMTFALLLELTQRVGHHNDAVKSGRWSESTSFCFWDYPLVELDGLTMGIVGLGRIGQAVATLAQAFGMKVIATSRSTDNQASGIAMVDLDTLFREADIVTLHCPLTQDTRESVNQQRLQAMKPTAMLLNTSRGPLIVEEDLADALRNGVIRGAAVDVLGQEPPARDNPLFNLDNCVITPHISWATRASRARLLETTISNLRAYLQDELENVVF